MRPRVLLANEAGAGRGHILTLRSIAQGLGPGFDYDAALARMDHAGELADINATCFPGVALAYDRRRRQGPGAVPTATWADYLGDLGFADPERLRAAIGWWVALIVQRGIEVLVADYAPTAMLAAQALAARAYPIRIIATGTGYGILPETQTRCPPFLPEFTETLHSESRLLANVNRAGAAHGLPPLPRLAAIYRAGLTLVRSLPMLDPFAAHRHQPHITPLADIAPQLARDGTEIFAYFSTTEFQNPDLVAALCGLDLPLRCFFPQITDDLKKRLQSAGIIVESAPVPVGRIAEKSRLLLHSGQHGILCLGLFAGLPQVAMPQHLEQLYHARRAKDAGLCRVIAWQDRSADSLINTIRAAYADPQAQAAARATARSLRAALPDDPAQSLRDHLATIRQAFGAVVR